MNRIARFALIVLSLLTAMPDARGHHAEPATTAVQQVIAAELAWSDAFLRHDLDRISGILSDDFIGIDGRGVVSDKTAELEEAKGPQGKASAAVLVGEELSDVRVRVYGDAAVLTAVNTARFRSHHKESIIRYRRTTVYVHRDDRWQCVSFHGSRILEPLK